MTYDMAKGFVSPLLKYIPSPYLSRSSLNLPGRGDWVLGRDAVGSTPYLRIFLILPMWYSSIIPFSLLNLFGRGG